MTQCVFNITEIEGKNKKKTLKWNNGQWIWQHVLTLVFESIIDVPTETL